MITVYTFSLPGGWKAVANDWGQVEAVGATEEEAKTNFIQAWRDRDWLNVYNTGAQILETGDDQWTATFSNEGVDIEVQGDTYEQVAQAFMQEWRSREWPAEQFVFTQDSP